MTAHSCHSQHHSRSSMLVSYRPRIYRWADSAHDLQLYITQTEGTRGHRTDPATLDDAAIHASATSATGLTGGRSTCRIADS